MKVKQNLFMFALTCFLGHAANAQISGITNIPIERAVRIDGTYHRTVYAPRTDQSINIDGDWHALLSEKGIQVNVYKPIEKKTVTMSMIGEDQFELSTMDYGFQEGAVRTTTNGNVVGPDALLPQYIVHRINNNGTQYKGVPNYASSWVYIETSLKADANRGLKCNRSSNTNSLDDKWYVSEYVNTNKGQRSFTGYPDGGFLAMEYKSGTGALKTGEVITVKEYWPKEQPSSSEDVYPFSETEIVISSVKTVTDVNLLPVVTYNKTGVSDYRLSSRRNNKPIYFGFSHAHWIPKGSSGWKTLERLSRDNKPVSESLYKRNRLIIIIAFFTITAAFLLSLKKFRSRG